MTVNFVANEEYTCPICLEPETKENRFVDLTGVDHTCLTNKVHEACINGWLKVNKGLPKCPICMIPITHVGNTKIPLNQGSFLLEAVKKNDLPGVQNVLKEEGIPLESYKDAMSHAVLNDYGSIVDALLKAEFAVGEEARGNWVEDAAARGNIDIVNSLLSSGPISESNRGGAVTMAASEGCIPIVQTLLANGPISEKDRGDALIVALDQNHPEAAAFLFEGGPISKHDINAAVRRAALKGHIGLLKILLEKDFISTSVLKVALQIATDANQFEAAEILLKKLDIP